MVDAQVDSATCLQKLKMLAPFTLADTHFLYLWLYRTMLSQLLVHERIETTLPKAKELRRVADQVVTMSKEVRSSRGAL